MKIINFGFIILCPDPNIGGLKNTLRSINNTYPESSVISIVAKDITKEQISEMKEICEVHKGGKTITSLINKGFEKTKCDWSILIIGGARICKNINKKYSFFIESERDVLYPLIIDYDMSGYPINIHNRFENCTLNGMCINKNFFKNVGKLTDNPLEISRKFWALEAKLKDANFKSILGIRIC